MSSIRNLPLLLALTACGATASTTPAAESAGDEADQTDQTDQLDQADQVAASVSYYRGTSTTTSPDGSTPYGPPATVLVRRHVDPSAGIIEESVVNDGRSYPTTLRQIQGTEFSARDEDETFSGTLTFSGPEWAWTSWTYELSISDGSGTLRGSGTLSADGIHTEKMFHAPDGSAQARIVETLTPIDEATYEQLLAAQPAPAE